MTKISVALTVYNEEENLKSCLESVEELADEIVIVDGGSTDKTVEVANSFGAKVIQTKNLPNFHINKNKAIDGCSGDWILQLDADEVVSRELKEEIKKMVSKKSDTNGYWIPRRNFFLGKFLKKGGQYPDYTMRLYKKGYGRLPAKDVHEQAEVSGKTDYLNNDLLHLRDKTFTSYMERFNRYTDLFAMELQNKKIKKNIPTLLVFSFLKPFTWFIKAYLRHKGFVDGFPGFVFALFSSLRFPVSYFKYWSNNESSN